MESIHFDENENTKFERNCNQISFKDYLKERYSQDCNFREFCVIKNKFGSAFLPQFLNISATNEMLGNDGIDQIRDELENMPPTQKMNSIQTFVDIANKRSAVLSQGFSTMINPTLSKAQILPQVFLEVITRNGLISKNQFDFPKEYKYISDFNNVYGNKWETNVQSTKLRTGPSTLEDFKHILESK